MSQYVKHTKLKKHCKSICKMSRLKMFFGTQNHNTNETKRKSKHTDPCHSRESIPGPLVPQSDFHIY